MNISGRTVAAIVGVGLLIVGLVAGWAGRGALAYRENVATVGTYFDWRAACPAAQDKTASCQMVQDVVDGKSGREIAQIGVLRQNGNPVIGVTMPYDVLLQPGLGFVVGTAPVKTYPYRTCNNVGCLVVIPLDTALSASLQQAQDAHIIFAGMDQKPVSVPVSLKGYVAARKAMESGDGARKSWFWRMWS